jgi:chromosomal replication initiator protein
VAYPRQVAMFLCKEMIPSLSLKDVGEEFGGKDHSTVLFSCVKVSEKSGTDPETRQTLEQLRKRLRNGG